MREPTRAQLRELQRINAAQPVELAPVPPAEWPNNDRGRSQIRGIWRSRSFAVFLWEEPNGYERLSVQRTEYARDAGRFADGISWEDLQRLKREAGFGDRCAVEVYPPESEVVNVANMRHLFLLPELPPYLWRSA